MIGRLFGAVRLFAWGVGERGYQGSYDAEEKSVPSLLAACERAQKQWRFPRLLICEPGEYRLLEQMKEVWPSSLGTRVTLLEDDRFLASHTDFAAWAQGKKQLRMEFFYRKMRQRYQILMEGSEPAGGQWNYDADNRVGWRNQVEMPDRPDMRTD